MNEACCVKLNCVVHTSELALNAKGSIVRRFVYESAYEKTSKTQDPNP